MNLDDYKKLDDFLSVKEIKGMFEEALGRAREYEETEFLEILWELSRRQADTYKILAEPIRERVDFFVSSCWSTDSIDKVETFAAIVLILGLKHSFEKMKESLSEELCDEVRKEIMETIEEAGDHIENPYHSYEKFK